MTSVLSEVSVLFVIQDHDHRVAEAAVVGFPHDLYGEGMHMYICMDIHMCTCYIGEPGLYNH